MSGTVRTDIAELRERVPARNQRNIAVRTTRDALRWLRAGSPWLYDGSINSLSHRGEAGDLAVVFDRDRKFAAIGLFDPDSPIMVKVLHAGKPVQVDAGFWADRVRAALDRRASLIADPTTTAYRCAHGENDGLPGFVADRYEDTLVVKLYSAVWWVHLRALVDALVGQTKVDRVVLRLARQVAPAYGLGDGDVIHGPPIDGPVLFTERGLVMEADVVSGQKTGHFLDQRDNRALVRSMAEGSDVLDVFSSTGGFSVSAAAGGARSVYLVDQSAPAITTARRNLDHNRSIDAVRDARVDATVGDAFEVLDEMGSAGRRFDLVVVDPPSFAHNQESVERARRAYSHLTRLAVGLVKPGDTLIMCSCSSRVSAEEFEDIVVSTARRAKRPVTIERRTGHAADHPIGFEHGAYLKALVTTVH